MRKPPHCVVKGFIIGKREKISREDKERRRLEVPGEWGRIVEIAR